LVFFACHLVSSPQKRCLQHKEILINQFHESIYQDTS
jgi:hypothetical protein